MRYTFVIASLLLFSVSGMSKIISVAKSGGDFSTITARLNASLPGDTVIIKGGVYNELITWPKSGAESGGYITLRAAGDSPLKPVLNFFVLVEDFHLRDNSPAIDGCAITYLPSDGELDLDRNKRKAGNAVDIGAYEANASDTRGNGKPHITPVCKAAGIDIKKNKNYIKVRGHSKKGTFLLDGTLSTNN